MKRVFGSRSVFAKYPESPIIQKYKTTMMEMLHLNFPLLSEQELSAAIDYSISNHFKNGPLSIDNNYKHQRVETTILDAANYIATKQPILTSSGLLMQRHGVSPNPVYYMLDGFINDRKAAKKKMYEYPVGSADYAKYDLIQLLHKIDANGFYGATGQYSCIFYNIYTATATTIEGRSCNSAAALFLESFMNNNVPYGSMNEIIEFIHNVLMEERVYNYLDIITIHPSIEEVFFQLLHSTGFGFIPTYDEMSIIWEILEKLNQDDLDRLYYKNNLFKFINNEPVKQAIIYILQTLEAPFMDPNDPPKEIKTAIDEFCRVLQEFVYYKYQIIDRVEKMDALYRSVSAIQDTDSVILSFDGWYRYVRTMCIGIDMKIKNKIVDMEESLLTDEVVSKDNPEMVSEYSFIDDGYIDTIRPINPLIIIPQDGLRYSIINLLSYCVGKLINDYMMRYCDNSNTTNPRPCLITMKNEFLFKRLLTTSGKKHYVSKMELKEGHIVPEEKSLDVKGMEFAKSSSNAAIAERLKKIIYEDILNATTIDRIKVLQDIAAVEQDIYHSISSGEKKFYKPVKIKSLSAYENPMRIQGISASYVYNTLHEPGTEAIDLSIRNSVDIIKVDMNKKNADLIRDSYPEVYEKLCALLNTTEFKGGISAVALPLNEPVPGWVLPFVEYDTIIKDNVSPFPIESIGFYRGADTNNSTNMIQF